MSAAGLAERAVASGRRPRLRGVDAARGLALLGMMSVHILPGRTPAGEESLSAAIAGGRSAALFAVLAGVAIALADGGVSRKREPLRATAAGLVVRAVLVGTLGLALVGDDVRVAVILPYYAVLFVVAIPFLQLPVAVLAPLAVLWALVAPALSHVLRAGLEPGPGAQPGLGALGDPAALATTLVLTGYYPAGVWVAYLLAGLAVGRLPLGRPAVAAWLLGVGVVLAVAAPVVSGALLAAGGRTALERSDPRILTGEFYGTTPTDTWWWLAVADDHSSTPLDMLHTIGTSLAILGAMLLLARVARRLILPLVGAGSAPLTLYTAHVVVLTEGWGPDGARTLYALHAAVALLVGLALLAVRRRGPLEAVTAAATRAVRALSGFARGAYPHAARRT